MAIVRTAFGEVLFVLAFFTAGEIGTKLLRKYLSAPTAKGVAYFAALQIAYLLFRKRTRYNFLVWLLGSAVVGLIAFLGEKIFH